MKSCEIYTSFRPIYELTSIREIIYDPELKILQKNDQGHREYMNNYKPK